jgi:[DsrC]-trisulfide reductase subunit J
MHRLIGLKRIAALVVGGILLSLSTAAISGSVVVEGSKAAGIESCVAPTADMRRNHMDYLKHERNEVVYEGVRGSKYSLADCVSCHASKDKSGHSIPVNAEKQFCDSCHDYAAVKITCFQCHRKVPEEK